MTQASQLDSCRDWTTVKAHEVFGIIAAGDETVPFDAIVSILDIDRDHSTMDLIAAIKAYPEINMWDFLAAMQVPDTSKKTNWWEGTHFEKRTFAEDTTGVRISHTDELAHDIRTCAANNTDSNLDDDRICWNELCIDLFWDQLKVWGETLDPKKKHAQEVFEHAVAFLLEQPNVLDMARGAGTQLFYDETGQIRGARLLSIADGYVFVEVNLSSADAADIAAILEDPFGRASALPDTFVMEKMRDSQEEPTWEPTAMLARIRASAAYKRYQAHAQRADAPRWNTTLEKLNARHKHNSIDACMARLEPRALIQFCQFLMGLDNMLDKKLPDRAKERGFIMGTVTPITANGPLRDADQIEQREIIGVQGKIRNVFARPITVRILLANPDEFIVVDGDMYQSPEPETRWNS